MQLRSLFSGFVRALVSLAILLSIASAIPGCIVASSPGYSPAYRGCQRYWVPGYCRFGRCYPGRWACR
ncbi:MAG: hypothetical protein JNK05_41010 [Myxococcales bacterium]|nr:hypothetical protein [Myxococcales bacterium]